MKKKNIIGIIAGILLFIITTIFIVILKKIDVIPDKYFMLLVATCYIVTIITDIFLFISFYLNFSCTVYSFLYCF